MVRFEVKTHNRSEFVDITLKVVEAVGESGVQSGIALVYCPHTTSAITINENADPDVVRDLEMKSSKLIERDDTDFTHAEGNSDSHLKSSLFGASEMLIVEGGAPMLGTWQGVYLAEFDGPRTRSVFVKVIAG
jgi:secondary thiamine-phosphate synthase enzyme